MRRTKLSFLRLCLQSAFAEVSMAKGLIWATAEDMARNRGRVLSLYRQILRSLNSPELPLNLAARLARKAEARAIFLVLKSNLFTTLKILSTLLNTLSPS
ncbi:UNVERIFIED_CONTAM: hypothetical protein Sradi_0131700 [Sesamum radiatum]|uniref:LYR motif containing domain-containing protein n=1 Tax=Sesamum radiatum TaxID=300843 RepID=A0AAW2WKD8_SESRA